MANPIERVTAFDDIGSMGIDLVAIGVIPHGARRDPLGAEGGRDRARREKRAYGYHHENEPSRRTQTSRDKRL